MALKGSASKEIAIKKILETFPNSFQYEKEIRIPMEENGELIQLKCVLTCAKINVEQNGDTAIPGQVSNEINFGAQIPREEVNVEATQEEKDNVARLAAMLNL